MLETPGPDLHGARGVPIRVWLALVPPEEPAVVTNESRIAPPEMPAVEPAAAILEPTEQGVQASAAADMTADAAMLARAPRVPDETVYSARDLDAYPVPVAPLDLGRLSAGMAGDGAREIRLELLIDEHGRVNGVTLAEPRTPGSFATQVRRLVASTRFIPARKEGRAVRSRILLSVTLGPEVRGP